MKSNPLFVFFGTTVDSRYALAQLARIGLEPALVVDTKDIPDDLANTEWDFFLVASYGKILPKAILDIPKHGCINIHPSLLPKYRGPSPYKSAILADDRTVGVTLMQMAQKMDAGPIIAQAQIEIAAEDWPPQGLMLSEMLFTEGVNLLAEVLPRLMDGAMVPESQDESQATYTKKFSDSDALIDLAGDARTNFLKIRAFDKDPRAHFFNEKGKRIIVTEADWVDDQLIIKKVLPEGKKEMQYEDYIRGQR